MGITTMNVTAPLDEVDAKDVLHVKARAWFTAWRAEFDFRPWLVSMKGNRQTNKKLKLPSSGPTESPRTTKAHLDQPQKMRRIITKTTLADPIQMPTETLGSSSAPNPSVEVEQSGMVGRPK